MQPPKKSKPPRKGKSGAPKGNINRLKHGFYSPRFTDPEILDLTEILGVNPTDEITLLRVLNRRIFEIFDRWSKLTDLDQIQKVLPIVELVGRTAIRISTLIKALHLAQMEGAQQTTDLILQAIDELNSEWDAESSLDKPPLPPINTPN